MQRVIVWYDDFKDFRALSSALNGYTSTGRARVVRYARAFIEVEGDADAIAGLYEVL